MSEVAVIGAGLMGHGIAAAMARAGHGVAVFDPAPVARAALPRRAEAALAAMGVDGKARREILSGIAVVDSVAGAAGGADAVFEAAPENLEIKRKLFAEIDACAPKDAILASNTSAIPIGSVMDGLERRERALGAHWWNPPHMIPLVEVIRTEWTSDAAMDAMEALLASAGKSPVRVEKDVPGFIGNRLQHAMWREAISLVERGVCTAEAVDEVVKAGFGRRLAALGPLENADLVGLELVRDIHGRLLPDLDASSDPSPLLQDCLNNGRSGMAAGGGFRDWTGGAAEAISARLTDHLRKLETILPDEIP